MLLHRLALALGRTVQEIEDQMSVREFADWAYFLGEYPTGDILADLHHGHALALLANVNRSSSTPAFRPVDFMLLAKPQVPAVVKPSTRTGETIADRFARVANG